MMNCNKNVFVRKDFMNQINCVFNVPNSAVVVKVMFYVQNVQIETWRLLQENANAHSQLFMILLKMYVNNALKIAKVVLTKICALFVWMTNQWS